MIIAYIVAPFFWSVSCIFTFPMGTKEEISKCMLNVCVNVKFIYIYIHICNLIGFLLNVSLVFWDVFIWKLFCMDLFILNGFSACVFIGTLFSKLIKGSPTPFYFEPLLCWATCYLTPPHQLFFWENLLRKIYYLGQGSPHLISKGTSKGYYLSIYQSL